MGLFIYAALAGLVFGIGGALAMRTFGAPLGFIDVPNERSSHTRVTPRGGGVGIALGYVAASVFSAISFPAVLSGGAMGLLGLVEDRFNLSSLLRLALQLIICALAIVALKGAPTGLAGLALLCAMVLFACGTANFYNFMDGINGMAGLTGVAAFASLAFFAWYVAGDGVAAVGGVFIAMACAGFLPMNVPKASVFMGDVGSMFLGFEFAYATLHFSTSIAGFLCVAMFLSLFYADCLITLAMRGMEGRTLMQSHRSHLYQYLSNELGIKHWKVSVAYAAAQLAVSALSIAAYGRGIAWQVLLFVAVSLCFTLVYRSIKGFKPSEARHQKQAGARL